MRFFTISLFFLCSFLSIYASDDEILKEIEEAMVNSPTALTGRNFFILADTVAEPELRQQVVELSLLAYAIGDPTKVKVIEGYVAKKFPTNSYGSFLQAKSLQTEEGLKAAYETRLKNWRTVLAAVRYKNYLNKEGHTRSNQLASQLEDGQKSVLAALVAWQEDPTLKEHRDTFKNLGKGKVFKQECRHIELILTALYKGNEIQENEKYKRVTAVKAYGDMVLDVEKELLSYDVLQENLAREITHLKGVLMGNEQAYSHKASKAVAQVEEVAPAKQEEVAVVDQEDSTEVEEVVAPVEEEETHVDMAKATPNTLTLPIKEMSLYMNRANRSAGKTLFRSVRAQYAGRKRRLILEVTKSFLDTNEDARLSIVEGLLQFWARRLQMNRAGSKASAEIAIVTDSGEILGGGTGEGDDIWFR